jgi:hypothetical protein
MTRILYWNLQNFSLPKIFDTTNWPAFVQSQNRLNHILNEVIAPTPPLPANSPPPPDIIVISEIFSRTREVSYEGNVVGSGTRVGQAVLRLLDSIRNRLGNTWCCVPPISLGNFGIREAVAVYYNSAALTFTGPYVWSQAVGLNLSRPSTAPNIANVVNYPISWQNALPNPTNPIGVLQLNRTWAAGGGAMINEWQGAGQFEFYNVPPAGGGRINFPGPNNRGPFYTRLLDAGGRTIRLFTVHTSPATAVAATVNVAGITELQAIAANEVNVILGDFNVDTFNMAVNGAYVPIENLGYEMLIDSRDPANNAVTPARLPYCLTHFLPNAYATPFNNGGGLTDPQHNVYPRFGYMGSTTAAHLPSDAGSIDNVFTLYPPGAGAPVPAGYQQTIVNTVVGKPYNQLAPAPAGVSAELIAGYGYNSSLANAIPQPGGVAAAAGIGAFRNWPNFQRIVGTSDHLAIVFNV